ncbi:MAG TPA: HpcH/HpaI aldolase/citrate lyase family protein [Agitococcus sp.]|nr:HpcH/HpaI aldolase/citrate lyase family protein [Agitococcus sp.]
MEKLSPYALGATLYMPATRNDLLAVVCGEKIPQLRSLVICLEDAVAEHDVEFALNNLQRLLLDLSRIERYKDAPLVFVRPRHLNMAKQLVDWPLMSLIDGFVLPKFTLHDVAIWQHLLQDSHLRVMPTLESKEVFDATAMTELAHALQQELNNRVLVLRIGGNDLLSCLGLRRSKAYTLYQSPVGYVIGMLSGVMGAAGFSLTAPVCELLQQPELLRQELVLDIEHGLVGKTAIHPTQISIIHQALQVSVEDYQAASLILKQSAPAVFQHNGAMCEPATHYRWAKRILERAYWYGMSGASEKLIV